MKILVCLAVMLGGTISAQAEEKTASTPVLNELEFESDHIRSFGYFRAAKHLGKEGKPGVLVSVRGFRLREEHGLEYRGFLEIAGTIPLVKPGHERYLELSPGITFMASDRYSNGIGHTLEVSAGWKRASVRALFERIFSFGGENGFLRAYPIWGEFAFNKRLSLVGVAEITHAHGKTEAEKGAGLSIKHFHGRWFAYWLTGVEEEEAHGVHHGPLVHNRFHVARFGRSFEFGGHHE